MIIRLLQSLYLLVLVSFLAAHGNLTAQNKMPDSPFYPLKVGSTWHYRAGNQKIVVQVTGHEKVAEVLCARVEAAEKETTKVEYIGTKEDGLYRFKIKDQELKPPLCFFKLPPKKGETWTVNSQVDGVKIKGTFVMEEEEVTVPAGKFKSFKVASRDYTIGARSMPLTYWFVKDIGIVKHQLEIVEFELILELEKFTPGH